MECSSKQKSPVRSRAFFVNFTNIPCGIETVALLSAIVIKRFRMPHTLQAVVSRWGLALLLFLTGALSAFAQSDFTAEADGHFERGGYFEASKEYIKAYPRIKNDIEDKARCAFQIGECFRLMLDPGAAAEWYDKAIGLRYGEDHPEIFLNYGDIMVAQQEFDEAIEWFQTYNEKGGDAAVSESRISQADEDALALDEPPSRYLVSNLLLLNSDAYDFGAGFASKKSDEVVFASSRESATGSGEDPITGQSFMDLFRAEQDKKGRWSTPEPLNNTVNTPSNEGTVTFDKKFKTMYFTRCIVENDNNYACDIYRASVMGTRMGPSELVELVSREVNDSSQVGHPAMSPEGDFLLFVSDMPGGQGGKDIWYVKYDEREDTFGEPVNMGPGINTPEDDMFPAMRYDGALYFASKGHGGLGGFDIVRAMPTEGEMKFGEVEVMPYPINSSSDDFGIIFYDNEDRGMFTSSRPGGKGKDDLYSFELPDIDFCFRANVYDYDTGIPLMGKVTVVGSDGNSWELTADAEGGVSLCEEEIQKSTTYTVEVKHEGYIGTGDKFSTVGLTESTTMAREYFLKEISEKEYPMPLVLYPFNQADLLINEEVNSADSLNYLLDLLQVNETFVIQLEAHTDSRGDNAYNKELSQRRAQTCVDYLISRGIAADRLIAVGRGEDQLLVTDAEIKSMATDEEREAAHQTNRRTVFRIVRFDYVPNASE